MADAIGYMLSPHPRLDPIAEDVGTSMVYGGGMVLGAQESYLIRKAAKERTYSKDFAAPWLRGGCSSRNQAAVESRDLS